MKKLFTLLFLFVAFNHLLYAQNTLDNVGLTIAAPASVAYSLRQLSTSYTGPLVRIKVGGSFYDVYPETSTKNFSLSSKISTAIGTYNAGVSVATTNALSTIISVSTDASVAIWYDQSGNGVNVLSSNATAKIITAGAINTVNGQATIYFNGSTSSLVSSTTVNYSAQTTATINAVAQNVASTDYISGIISTGSSGGWGLCYDPTNSHPGYWIDASGGNGAFSNEFTSETKIITGLIGTTTNSAIYINSQLKGTKVAQPISNGSSNNIYVGRRGGDIASRQFNGNISEIYMFPKNLSDAELFTLESSQSIFLPPTVTITSSASGAVCAGTNVTFTANAQNFSTTPTYQWYKNGTTISGATNATYTTSSLSNNDIINVSCSTVSNIVNDNTLALWLDAGNATSYSGTGTTWYDISGNNKNATLTSDQSFSSGDGGSIQFNGGQNAVSIPLVSANTANVTMQTWVYLDANTKGPFFKNGSNNGYVFGTGNGGNGFEVGNKATMLFAGARWITTTTNYGYGWKLVTMVINSSGVPSMYINNTQVSGTYTGNNALTPNTGTYLGRNVGDDDVNWPKFNGKMAAVYFYTKALSQSEINQNYDALAARFGFSSSNSIVSNSISITISALPVSTIIVSGDNCINKTTLSTTSGLTSYTWYKDNVAISGATSNTYIPTTAGAYKVVVSNGTCNATSTPTTITNCGVTADGSMSVLETSTTLVSKDGAKNNGKGIDENGKILSKPWVYGTVTTGTGRIWLDRNLGASRVATSSTDTQAYGDYYQWGRPADGHQTKYLTNNNSTGFTNTKSATTVPSTDLWIEPTDGSNDWLITPDNTLWTGSNPPNNPCPAGYRIPTESEWNAEKATWSSQNAAGAFASPLKLTQAGMLTSFGSSGANFTAKDNHGQYLTQTASSDGRAKYFGLNGSGLWWDNNYWKSHGQSCRCIKD